MDVIGLAAEALKPISDEGTIVQQGWYDESLKRLHGSCKTQKMHIQMMNVKLKQQAYK